MTENPTYRWQCEKDPALLDGMRAEKCWTMWVGESEMLRVVRHHVAPDNTDLNKSHLRARPWTAYVVVHDWDRYGRTTHTLRYDSYRTLREAQQDLVEHGMSLRSCWQKLDDLAARIRLYELEHDFEVEGAALAGG